MQYFASRMKEFIKMHYLIPKPCEACFNAKILDMVWIDW